MTTQAMGTLLAGGVLCFACRTEKMKVDRVVSPSRIQKGLHETLTTLPF